MRILVINSEYPPIGGGAGNASANLSKGLVALNQEVVVLTVHYKGLPRDTIEGGVRVLRLKSLRRVKNQSGAFEQGIFLLVGLAGTLTLMRKWRPDIILAFFGVPGGAVAWMLRKFTRIPYMVSLRGGDVPGFRPYDFAFYHGLVSPLLHLVWRKAEAVVANSMGLKTIASGFDSQVDIQVIPNGVNVDGYPDTAGRDWDSPKLLWVGRIVYQKGLDVLIRALGELRTIPWTLTLVGDGPDQAGLENLAQELGITERIAFKGWLAGEQLSSQYREANLFVFPSRHEGMPNAVLEAMASGLPVIASQIAGNEELVIPGKTGLLVPPEDTPALRHALGSLLLDAARRMQMGLAARERVRTHYTWDNTARQYLALMQKFIE